MKEGKKATVIGVTCIFAYVVNYYLRNVLSVLTPTMLATGLFTKEHIAALSSTYMLLYAAGQLVNGFLGDILSPKKMASAGLLVAGVSLIAFPFVSFELAQIICFAVFGFGLSMMRGPLMKIISENTRPNHARLICVFFSFASFAGPLVASMFALIRGWNWVFVAAGGVSAALSVVVYLIITIMEKKGLVTYIKTEVKGISSILSVFKIEKIAFYIIVACLVEIGAASIGQWITTFLTEQLTFDKETANLLYSGISTIRSFMPFVSLFIFRAIKEKDMPMMKVTFSISTVMFLMLLIAPNRWFSLAFLTLALMASSATSALLWSIYIPSLGKTGKVSSVNGVIDCLGYIAAAGANLLFANVMENVGWNTVYILWASIGVIGLVAAFAFGRKKQKA